MKHPHLRITGDVLLLVVVILALVVAAGLLHQVAAEARSVNGHAKTIAMNTRGIDDDTDAIAGLRRTNALAASILRSARPLDNELTTTVNRANAVDGDVRGINDVADRIRGTAGSIAGTAAAINTRAGTILADARAIQSSTAAIDGLASSINTVAAAILDVSGRINGDVEQINRNLDKTIEIASQIHQNTARLVAAGIITRAEAACIDEEIHVLTPANRGGATCGQRSEEDRHDR